MAEPNSEIVAEVVETCRASLDEAAQAFARALGLPEPKLTLGEPASYDGDIPKWTAGPGIGIVIGGTEATALLFLAQENEMLPQWCKDPDPTGQSRLQTLAQELGVDVSDLRLVLPATHTQQEVKIIATPVSQRALPAPARPVQEER